LETLIPTILGFSQELKMTSFTEFFIPNNLTFNSLFPLQCFCKETKIPSWPIMQQSKPRKWEQWETKITRFCSFC